MQWLKHVHTRRLDSATLSWHVWPPRLLSLTVTNECARHTQLSQNWTKTNPSVQCRARPTQLPRDIVKPYIQEPSDWYDCAFFLSARDWFLGFRKGFHLFFSPIGHFFLGGPLASLPKCSIRADSEGCIYICIYKYVYTYINIYILAPFEKFWSMGKEEARTGWSNVDRGPRNVSRKPYSLDQSGLEQHNALSFMFAQFRTQKLHSYSIPLNCVAFLSYFLGCFVWFLSFLGGEYPTHLLN